MRSNLEVGTAGPLQTGRMQDCLGACYCGNEKDTLLRYVWGTEPRITTCVTAGRRRMGRDPACWLCVGTFHTDPKPRSLAETANTPEY